jgi:hypothetical protein
MEWAELGGGEKCQRVSPVCAFATKNTLFLFADKVKEKFNSYANYLIILEVCMCTHLGLYYCVRFGNINELTL